MINRRRAALVLIFFGLLYTLTNSYRETVQIPDEEYVLLVTANLVRGEPLHLSDDVPRFSGAYDIGKDGKAYSSYQIGQSLFYAPFYFVTRHLLSFSEPYVATKFGTEKRYEVWLEKQTRRFLYLCPTFFAALSCALLFLFACRLGYSERTALILTLMYGLGTMVWPYSRYLLTEISQNTLLLGTVYLLFAQRQEGKLNSKAMVGAGALFGLLLSIRAIFIVVLPILALYWFIRNRERRLVAPLLMFAVPMVAWLIPQLIYDQIRFGNMLSLGYQSAGFTTPLYVGLFGYLLSPGKSFFLYTPIVILSFFSARAFFSRASQEAILFLLMTVAVLLKYAGWWVWSGDPSWGPRYLLVLTPFLILPVAEIISRVIEEERIWRRAVVGTIFAISMGVQLLGIMVYYVPYFRYVQKNASMIPKNELVVSPKTESGALPIRDRFIETSFNPEYSPILGHAWMAKSLLTGDEKPGLSAPWSGLGFSELHADAPLEADWDLWIVRLVRDGMEWKNFRIILGTIALFIVLTIVGQELFMQVFWRPKETSE